MHLRRLLFCALLVACDNKVTPPPAIAPSHLEEVPAAALQATHSTAVFSAVPRMDFNRLAAELALPLYWGVDKNGSGSLDPDELVVLWGVDPEVKESQYLDAKGFTAAFKDTYARIQKRASGNLGPVPDQPAEAARRAAVVKELSQGRQTLIFSDFTKASEEDKRFLEHLLRAAALVETLFGKQMGTLALRSKVPTDDPASKMLFFRNQGPRCQAPLTEGDPSCSAIPDPPKGKLSGLYPEKLLAQPKFCEELAKKADKKLVDPFTVVVEEKSGLKAVPYHEFYKAEMTQVAQELRAAAEALDAKEQAFTAYLGAQAKAFETGSWFEADEAWAKMGVRNSRFYLRIAPDEVYAEPCSNKALFHVSFGTINQKSITWQDKLDPLKGDMEKAIAELAGAPYKARAVAFKLPDFMDVVLNSGDSRNAFGATIGQSLPNFGPVANGGRGRTVAMTNFYTDPDSVAAQLAIAESLLCKGVMSRYTTDPEPQLMSTVLHEAAHNLGPAHQYKVGGKIDRDQFGGPLASTLEELKAQTAALFFTDWLVAKNQLTKAAADRAHVRDVLWAFGHISRGMYNDEGHPKNYSQLAAIQLGELMAGKAVTWHAEEMAANGADQGCFQVHADLFPEAARTLMKVVGGIKARGDKARAEALVKKHVGLFKAPKPALHTTIETRVLRQPKPSFVYAIRR